MTWRRFLMALLLIFVVGLGAPRPAQACGYLICPGDIIFDAGLVAEEAAGFAEKAAAWVTKHAEDLLEFLWEQGDAARVKAQQTVLSVAETLSLILGAEINNQRQKDALAARSDITRGQTAALNRGQTLGRAPTNNDACVVIKLNQAAVQGGSFFDVASSTVYNLLLTRCPAGSDCLGVSQVGVTKGVSKNVGVLCTPPASGAPNPEDSNLLCGAGSADFGKDRIMELPSAGAGQIKVSNDLHQRLWNAGMMRAFADAGPRPPAPLATENSNYSAAYKDCLGQETGDLTMIARHMARYTRPNCADAANKAVCAAQQMLCNIALNNRGVVGAEVGVTDCTKGLTPYQIEYLVHKGCMTDQGAIQKAGGASQHGSVYSKGGGDDAAADKSGSCKERKARWEAGLKNELEYYNEARGRLAALQETCWSRLRTP